ncbi:sensor histidine kinase [Streptomyces sp. YIM 130001]|uniref:sensor histidine kinase n=1 Tax=Streptomyces sp. YIM 130001 TaxID=2259644 RepID=UPI000E65CD65|nr:sensor histidine kinase [Streptomyces sp. YIM 130001]
MGPGFGIGQSPDARRALTAKVLWIGLWLFFLAEPADDLLHGRHGVVARVCGTLGLLLFVGTYVVLVFRHTSRLTDRVVVRIVLGALPAGAVVLALTLGEPWLVLFVYVAVACGAVLPARRARFAIPAATSLMVVTALVLGVGPEVGLMIPALLGGFSMVAVGQLVRTTVQLREARAQVAQLAANEERLRLARDLHDLLGHSLSLITLKSELAGRMLPDRPEQAASQVADIEAVGRQALADVREAVTGYRRPRLAGELAAAQEALRAVGMTAAVPGELPSALGDAQEAALAWTLREAVTNVVRHSGGHRCVVGVVRRETLDGPVVELSVEDDGAGPSGAAPGNGLAGLTERLAAAGGTLETGAAPGHGFRLVARVPAAP